MKSVVIENPILNSPYEEPQRHFRFDDDGITDEVVEGRRPSSYFGEPDLTVKQEDDEVTVELRGVDVYDPTTGEVRSSSTEDVACWFIDTDDNGESFFVRHAYFTGGDEPYDKLRRALRADIDEAAWSTLYATVSRPFDPSSTGKIAVKVINHYGDEVMHVYEVTS